MIKKSRFSTSLFVIYLIVLLFMCSVHTGIIILSNKLGWSKLTQVILPIVYWVVVSIGLTFFTRKMVINTYEKPMKDLAKATRKVANGDFSVYVPTLNTYDKLDYLDVMIMDFNKMVEELGSIETLKTDFVSNVSHEMKTPIAIIKNYAELIKSNQISDEQKIEYSQSIIDTSERLSNLVTNILKLNKLENQNITTNEEVYDICRQLCDSIILFEDMLEEKGIEFEIDIEYMSMIKADKSLLEIVWNNLISNAIKFTDSGGMITIKQISKDDKIQVIISDTGCGISSESVKHIFDKFYQGDTSHSKEGNGLGLAMVKRVIELLDGEIQVFSEKDKGTTFIVILHSADIVNNMSGD